MKHKVRGALKKMEDHHNVGLMIIIRKRDCYADVWSCVVDDAFVHARFRVLRVENSVWCACQLNKTLSFFIMCGVSHVYKISYDFKNRWVCASLYKANHVWYNLTHMQHCLIWKTPHTFLLLGHFANNTYWKQHVGSCSNIAQTGTSASSRRAKLSVLIHKYERKHLYGTVCWVWACDVVFGSHVYGGHANRHNTFKRVCIFMPKDKMLWIFPLEQLRVCVY